MDGIRHGGKEDGRSVIGIHADVSSLGNVNLLSEQTKVKSILDFTCLYRFINILIHMGGKADVPAISWSWLIFCQYLKQVNC
jgi:hypothetical protein